MSKQTKTMTPEQVLNLTLKDLGFRVVNATDIATDYHAFSLATYGIKIQSPPPITQANLGRFMVRFNGELPEAEFKDNGSGTKTSGRLGVVEGLYFRKFETGTLFPYCNITDPRWSKENLDQVVIKFNDYDQASDGGQHA